MAHTRLTMVWTGAVGLPGYSRMSWAGELTGTAVTGVANRMSTFFNAIRGYVPTDINLQIDGVAQVFDASGSLVDEVGFTPPAAITGGGGNAYSAATGFVVNWLTGSFTGGRRNRGRTFLVPFDSGAFATDGTPATAALSIVSNAANTLVAGSPAMVIFGGPEGGPNYEAIVTSATVPDRAAVLRSRRD